MNRKLVLSFVARNDLANIRDYISERNPVAADRVIDRIEAACPSSPPRSQGRKWGNRIRD